MNERNGIFLVLHPNDQSEEFGDLLHAKRIIRSNLLEFLIESPTSSNQGRSPSPISIKGGLNAEIGAGLSASPLKPSAP